MRKFSLALLAGTALLTTQAFAADLIIDTPVEPGVVTVSGDWEGAYVGIFGGYAAGEIENEVGATQDIDGWLIGFAAGYDVYLADSIVGGIVADIAWNDIANDTDTFTSDWNGSLRARLGYDAGAFLPYVTGGLAFTNGEGGGVSNTHWGWTVGAGVEVAVSEQLSLDLQYRYTDYAAADYSGSDVSAVTHAATVGLNWRF